MPNKASKEPAIGIIGQVLNYFSKVGSFVPKEELDTDLHINRDGIRVIPCYQEFNEWGLMLTKIMETSHTHRTIVHKKADLVLAKGFSVSVGEPPYGDIVTDKVQDETTPTDNAIQAFRDFAKRINVKDETLAELSKKAIINYEGYGFVCIELVRGEVAAVDGESGKFFNAYVHDFPKVLYKAPDVKGGDPNAVYICSDWCDYDITPKELSLKEWVKDENGLAERKAIILKAPSVLRDYYSLPPSIASLLYQQLQFHIPSQNLDDFFTDFMPKVFMQFYTSKNMSDEEWKDFYKGLEDTYTYKKGNRRKIFAQRTHHKDLETKIQTFDKGSKDGDYSGLTDKAKEIIYEAHVFHPLLAGSHEVTGFGNSNYVKNVFDIYNDITIKPLQDLLFEKIIHPIVEMGGEWLNNGMSNHHLLPTRINPINFIGEISPEKFLDVNEVRKLNGLSIITDFEEFTPLSSEKGKLFEYHLKAEAITVDELRNTIGLPELGGDAGGKLIKLQNNNSNNNEPNNTSDE